MKKSTTEKSRNVQDMFKAAEEVFSRGFVQAARDRGHGFLEGKREGSYVYDTEGKRYLDCYTSGGSYNLGRKNPEIIRRFKKAMYETDQGNFVMLSEEKAFLAKRLSEFMPGDLECVLFGVSRGESMEAACKLARGYTGRTKLLTVDGGSYGESGFALSLSQREGKEQFGALIPDVSVIPFGDIEAARKAIGKKVAALVMEPIQAENHCRAADNGYYREVRTLCDLSGVKLIFDETQSGFGRTGRKFFFEHTGVVPDILIIGEAITSGMFPMTAMVFTPELKAFFDEHPLIHLCTFGGHDLGCRVAMASLDEYEHQAPWDNARVLGEKLLQELRKIAQGEGKTIVSVRGHGLLISLKFASEETALAFCKTAPDNGLLVNTGKVDASTVLFRPSLLLTGEEAGRIVEAVTKTLKAM
ncbi:MAG TPA: aspartate aminotransferase family protein [Deltaproteobacteria bacterium]|nr:aspartate aminotransferase family protein [Deltaproteobacteria bacterium]